MKGVAFVIGVLLFSMVVLPAMAVGSDVAEEGGEVIDASSNSFTLEIYGNANMDDTIDMRDVTYIKLVIFRKKPETRFCDANHDGKISGLDVVQTKLIIVGKEGELTYVDVCGEAETIHKPIKRIVDLSAGFATEVMRALDAEDKIIAVTKTIADERYGIYPELSKLPVVAGSWYKPDFEAILSQNPDALITYIPWAHSWAQKKDEWKEKLPGVQIISLGFVNPLGAEWTGKGGVGKHNGLIENIRKLGYILDKEDEAEEFCDWYESWLK
ncbi:MAG: ABC transporter substrate-binding protein, partial [Candidatus Methanospirareceae archaeon]